MYLKENLKSSILNIKTHLLRTILTLLGITIGVFAVISLSSSIYIIKKTIKNEMKDLGWDNSITIISSSPRNFSFRRRHFGRRLKRFMYIQRKSSPLTLKDFKDIKQAIPTKYSYATVSKYGTFSYNGKTVNSNLIATNYDYLKLKHYVISKGRFFNEMENKRHLRVCVLSKKIASELTKNPYDLIGKNIMFEKNTFKVVGITEIKKDKTSFVKGGFSSTANEGFIPLQTGIFYFKNSNIVDYIYVQAFSEKSYNNMKVRVRQILLRNHNMAHDFQFLDVGSFMIKISQEINTTMKKWSVLFITIASVSLFVGGIGLFSTLIISITERMMEIGVRKSLGAKNSDIFMLFISEALILSLLAAIMGLGLSMGLLKIVTHFIKQSLVMPMQGIVLGFAFSIIIGFLSGLYPAIKAAKINPVQAIYYTQ